MLLDKVLEGIQCLNTVSDFNIEVDSICIDSRRVKKGDLFFCITGFESDGHDYAVSAVSNGACALVVEHIVEGVDVPQIVVENTRRSLAVAAGNFYDHPADKMKMIGITGTNGKTTTTYMIKKIAEECGHKVGLIGTIQNMIRDRVIHTERTTPDSLSLNAILADMYDAGCDTVVMEVSSHALALDRVYGIVFDIGIFSNLTQDHLDFHNNFEDYAKAKSILFSSSRISVINADDKFSHYMTDAAMDRVITYSIKNMSDYKAFNVNIKSDMTSFDVSGIPALHIEVGIPGLFTVYNSLAAAVASVAAGFETENIVTGFQKLKGVAGRFENLETHNGCSMILDYAHTPDSMENVLKTARGFVKGRLICVFGCGGNRDRTKRPKMAEIAVKYADFAIITTDNPRFEVPEEIIMDIEKGISDDCRNKYISIVDRTEAIRYALVNSKPDDVIILAGKGHETYQEIKGVKYDFDEKCIVAEIVTELKAEIKK